MKKFFMIFALSLVLFACGGGSGLEGTWGLDSVENADGSKEELSESEKKGTFTFEKGGKAIMKRGETEKTGTWSLSDDKKKLTMKQDGREKEEVLEIVELSSTTLKFKDGSDIVVLKKK